MKLEILSKIILEECEYAFDTGDDRESMIRLSTYNDLLMQPLTLSLFVECKDGVPLEKPKNYDYFNQLEVGQTFQAQLTKEGFKEWIDSCKAYEAAEKLVIFWGFEVSKIGIQSDDWLIQFSTNRIFLDRNVGDSLFVGQVINNPTISDLANATQDNPITLR